MTIREENQHTTTTIQMDDNSHDCDISNISCSATNEGGKLMNDSSIKLPEGLNLRNNLYQCNTFINPGSEDNINLADTHIQPGRFKISYSHKVLFEELKLVGFLDFDVNII